MTECNKSVTESAPDTQRIERFQSLQAGEYWTAQQDIPELGIYQGTTLLIASIDFVDDQAHTLILRPHPSVINQSLTQRFIVDGQPVDVRIHYSEHRIRLPDFLNAFFPEPDADRIRAQEVADLQKSIVQLQEKLIQTTNDPLAMSAIVQQALDQEASASPTTPHDAKLPAVRLPHSLSQHVQDAQDLKKASENAITQSLSVAGAPEKIDRFRKAAEFEYKITQIKSDWIASMTKNIAETATAMTPYFQEKAAAALASTKSMRRYISELMSGIASLELYTGEGVTVQTLCEGESAPASEPLTFVQRKLMMDEEMALWSDVGNKFDYRRHDAFYAELATNKDMVNAIFPAPRCVLVMATTRQDHDYGLGLGGSAERKANANVFILVRDGDNIYRVDSPIETHMGAHRLFPSMNDQDKIFEGFDGEKIQFNDLRFTQRLAQHDAHALHYKRFLILACGLDHRLNLFGPFYSGAKSFDFVSMAFQQEHFRFVFDDEGDTLLSDQSMRPVMHWMQDKNEAISNNSVVICDWAKLIDPVTAPGACKRDRGNHKDYHYYPSDKMNIVTAKQRDGRFVVTQTMASTRHDKKNQRNVMVDLTSHVNSDWYQEGAYLVLDSVTSKDLAGYMHSRTQRENYVIYMELFKQALVYVQARETAWGALKASLTAALDPEDRMPMDEPLEQAVHLWLRSQAGDDVALLESIDESGRAFLAELARTLVTAMDDLSPWLAQQAAEGVEVLQVCVNAKGKLVVHLAPTANERDDRLEPNRWVKEHIVTLGKRSARLSAPRWVWLGERRSDLVVLHVRQACEDYRVPSKHFFSAAHKEALFNSCSQVTSLLTVMPELSTPEKWDALFDDWCQAREKMMKSSSVVVNPAWAVPFGVELGRSPSETRLISLLCNTPHALLDNLAPCQQRRTQLRKAYISVYANKEAAQRFYLEELTSYRWTISRTDLSSVPNTLAGHWVSSGSYRARLGVDWALDYSLDLDGLVQALESDDKRWINEHIRHTQLNSALGGEDGARAVRVVVYRDKESGDWIELNPCENGDVQPPYAKQHSSQELIFPSRDRAERHIQSLMDYDQWAEQALDAKWARLGAQRWVKQGD